MAYVYEHYRADTGEVFYVGIGKTETRAETPFNRNDEWRRVSIQAGGYYVEVIADDISWDEACEMERTLIREYGRACYGNGPLTNITDGGEGWTGRHSMKARLKMSESKRTEEHRAQSQSNVAKAVEANRGRRKALKGHSVQELVKLYDEMTCRQIAKHLSISDHSVKKVLIEAGVYEPYKNAKYQLTDEQKAKRAKVLKQSNKVLRKAVLKVSLDGDLLEEFESLAAAAEAVGGRAGDISQVANGKGITAFGYKWQWKNENNLIK